MNDDLKAAGRIALVGAVELVKDFIPGVNAGAAALQKGLDERREKRLQQVLFAAFGDAKEPAEHAKRMQEGLAALDDASGDLVLSCLRRALDDDETAKSWFYGAMLRAFVTGAVPDLGVRLALLRTIGNVSAFELDWAGSALRGQRIRDGDERDQAPELVRGMSQIPTLIRALEIGGIVDMGSGGRADVPKNPTSLRAFMLILELALAARAVAAP